jgi:hypothetical protein
MVGPYFRVSYMSKSIEISDKDYQLILEIMEREGIDSIEKAISYLINQDDLLNYKKPKRAS